MLTRAWWKEAVYYQIYPMSFQDSNGDGIGDIPGIERRIPYLKELGIDVIWLSPVYTSPGIDNGYDISDYYSLDGTYGTMDDFQKLLDTLHKNEMKLVMDLVVNHTSTQHPWFIESSSSRSNPKSDWYIWRDPENETYPNNWESWFHQPAWEFCKEREQYYLHIFAREQADLNWENRQMRDEIYSMMRWWLEKGVDGFRMDVVNLLAKAKGLPDSKKGSGKAGELVFDQDILANQEGMHEILQEMRREVFSHYECVLIGETPNVNSETGLSYVSEEKKELDMIFHFETAYMTGLDLPRYKKIQREWAKRLYPKGWGTQFLSNHDRPRQVSVFGDDEAYRIPSAKLLGLLIHTHPGSPFIYQGEEIGMTNVSFPSIEYYRDVKTVNAYTKLIQTGADPEEALHQIRKTSRDNARTPMQWDSSQCGGFSSGEPWIPVNKNYPEINVASALSDSDSILSFYKKLITLRKEHTSLTYGDYQQLMPEQEDLFIYTRSCGEEVLLILANCTMKEVLLDKGVIEELLSKITGADSIETAIRNNCLLRTYLEGDHRNNRAGHLLRPFEGLLFSCG